MAKKKGVRYWHNKLWPVFSRYIRMRDYAAYLEKNPKLNTFDCPCITCGQLYEVKLLQAGHFISSTKTSIKYDEHNVHAQCYNCNVNLRGDWPSYHEAMLHIYGQAEIDRLMGSRFDLKKFVPYELEEMYVEYTEKLEALVKDFGSPWA